MVFAELKIYSRNLSSVCHVFTAIPMVCMGNKHNQSSLFCSARDSSRTQTTFLRVCMNVAFTVYNILYNVFYFVLHEAWCSVISDIFIMICQYMYVIYMDLAKELDSRIWQKYRGKVTPNIRMIVNMPFRINSRNQNECKCIYIWFHQPIICFHTL